MCNFTQQKQKHDRGNTNNFLDLKRPFTDQFLASMYDHFDIVFWSQTSWRWLEIKLTELGVLTCPSYKVS
jgi:hypothetical protein